VFDSERSSNREIYVMDVDGQNVERLTFDPEWDGYPKWSPDGSEIVFQSNRLGRYEVYMISADGTNLRRLTMTKSAL